MVLTFLSKHLKTCENLAVAFSWLREKIMMHTAETLLPWKEYCHNLNHSRWYTFPEQKWCVKCTLQCICLMDVVTSLNIITW